MFKNYLASLFVLIQILFSYFFWIPSVYADYIVTASDSLSNSTASANSNHTLTITNDIGLGTSGTITVTFPTGFTMPSGLDYTDMDFLVDGSQRTLATSASTGIDGISVSGRVVTITLGSSAGAGSMSAELRIGTNATSQSTGARQIANPSSTGSQSITVATSNSGGTITGSTTASVTITSSVPDLSFFIESVVILVGGWFMYRHVGELTKSQKSCSV